MRRDTVPQFQTRTPARRTLLHARRAPGRFVRRTENSAVAPAGRVRTTLRARLITRHTSAAHLRRCVFFLPFFCAMVNFCHMTIKGIEGMTNNQIEFEVQNGAKFVVFTYCISLLIVSFRRSSSPTFIKSHQNARIVGLPFIAISFFFGWWGIPWGIIYTLNCLSTDLSGGKDVTKEVMHMLSKEDAIKM